MLHGNRIKSISLSPFEFVKPGHLDVQLHNRQQTQNCNSNICILNCCLERTINYLNAFCKNASLMLSPIFQSFAQTSLSHAITSMFCDELQLQWKQPVYNKSNHQCHDKSWFLWHCFTKKLQNESQPQNVQLDLHVVDMINFSDRLRSNQWKVLHVFYSEPSRFILPQKLCCHGHCSKK